MKNVWTTACTLLFVSTACFALPAHPAPLTIETLTAILGESASENPCSPRAGQVLFASSGTESTCQATAFCWDGSTATCYGNTTCTAVDSNCSASQPGYATCDGDTVQCPACCNQGTIQERFCCNCAVTGNCQDCCRCNGGGPGYCAQICAL